MNTVGTVGTVALAVTDGMLPFELSVAHEVFGADLSGVVDSWYRLVVCGPGAVRLGRFRVEPDCGLDRPLTVEDPARRANMSSCPPGRRFRAVTGTAPLQWLLTQRIRRAQELLETTGDSVDAIAAATGMGTATTLRRHFDRALGVPPDTYRRTFRSSRSGGEHDSREHFGSAPR